MVDVDRDAVGRFVFGRLASDAEFRARLTATAPDGSRPILVALPGDRMSSVLANLDAFGGAGNVVVPLYGGVVVLAMRNAAPRVVGAFEPSDRDITPDCTVGVFLQRVSGDADQSGYRFIFEHDGHTDAGTAELVAISG
jgi:hypothetical protein